MLQATAEDVTSNSGCPPSEEGKIEGHTGVKLRRLHHLAVSSI